MKNEFIYELTSMQQSIIYMVKETLKDETEISDVDLKRLESIKNALQDLHKSIIIELPF